MYDLKLSEETFWEISPPEFTALMGRHREQRKWEDMQTSKGAALLANVNRDKKKRPKAYVPQDFMYLRDDAQTEQDVDDMESTLLMFTRKLGGRVIGDIGYIKTPKKKSQPGGDGSE